MPVEHHPVTHSQLAELLGYEPDRFVGIRRTSTGYDVMTEKEEFSADQRNMSPAKGQHDLPQAHQGQEREVNVQ